MSQDLRLFGAIAIRPVLAAVLPGFEAEAGARVVDRWELNPAVKQQIDAGAPFDVVVTNPHHIAALVASRRVRTGTQRPLGRVKMGVAARPGHPIRGIASLEDFTALLNAAASIAYASEGTSGAYFLELIERIQLSETLRPRLVPIAGGGTTRAVANGDAEIGVVPVTSIIAAAPAVELIGRFPEELQSHVDFDIGIASTLDDATLAHKLSDYLVSPDLDDALAARGLDRR